MFVGARWVFVGACCEFVGACVCVCVCLCLYVFCVQAKRVAGGIRKLHKHPEKSVHAKSLKDDATFQGTYCDGLVQGGRNPDDKAKAPLVTTAIRPTAREAHRMGLFETVAKPQQTLAELLEPKWLRTEMVTSIAPICIH